MANMKHPSKCLGTPSYKLLDRILHPHIHAGAFLILVCSHAHGHMCNEVAFSPELGTESSRWEEFSRTGKHLVAEHGRLYSKGLMLSARCSVGDWSLAWSESSGSRDYSGVSNTGQPATTVADIRQQKITGSAHVKAWEDVKFGGRVVHSAFHRNLQSTNTAVGYPEHFRFNELAVGVRYKKSLGEHWVLQADYWQGRIIPGQSKVAIPSFTPTTLQLGAGRSREIGFSLEPKQHANEQGWTWSAALLVRHEKIEEGAPQALYRGSRLVASAVQPEIRLRTSQFLAKVNYAF